MRIIGAICIGVTFVVLFHLHPLIGGVISFISYLAFSKK